MTKMFPAGSSSLPVHAGQVAFGEMEAQATPVSVGRSQWPTVLVPT